MTDSIGVLGSAAVLTAATTTIYTVGSGKAAKGRIFYKMQGAADGTTDLTITVNGIEVVVTANITASNFAFSSPNAMLEILATEPTGVDGDTTCAPAPIEFWLSAADTVTYTIGGADALAGSFQFVGTEIDV